MNNVGKTGAGVTPKGFWDAIAHYTVNDMVTYNGNAYYALQANTGIVPEGNADFWQLYVSKGDKGDPGAIIEKNFVDIVPDSAGYLNVPNDNIPVKVELNGIAYDIDDCPVINDGTNFKLLVDYFLAKANLSSYSGTYRVWRAGGKEGEPGERGEPGLNVPVGTIIAFAGETPPDGFLACVGAFVSRTSYADLFAVVGTLYGTGDGTTTFQLPDLRGRFLQGGTAGTYQGAGLPNIQGTLEGISWGTGQAWGVFSVSANSGAMDINSAESGNAVDTYYQFNAGNGNSIYGNSETVQPPALEINYCIKY
jgi:hypothetical protein